MTVAVGYLRVKNGANRSTPRALSVDAAAISAGTCAMSSYLCLKLFYTARG